MTPVVTDTPPVAGGISVGMFGTPETRAPTARDVSTPAFIRAVAVPPVPEKPTLSVVAVPDIAVVMTTNIEVTRILPLATVHNVLVTVGGVNGPVTICGPYIAVRISRPCRTGLTVIRSPSVPCWPPQHRTGYRRCTT